MECRAILTHRHLGVLVTVGITDAWYNAPGGRIPSRSQHDKWVGDYAVVLVGYDDSAAEFAFANSWGVVWGDKGYGYLPYDVFEATWGGGLVCGFIPMPSALMKPNTEVTELGWGVSEHGGGMLHCREFVGAGDERIAWAFTVERSGWDGSRGIFRPATVQKAWLRKEIGALDRRTSVC